MIEWLSWLIDNWLIVTTAVLVLLGSFVAGLWLRRVAYNAFDQWPAGY